MPLTETEKAYIAGIIDGEGSIMLQRSMSRASAAYVFPIIKVANTNLVLINWLKQKIENGALQYRSKSNDECKDVYHWTIASNQAVDLIEQVRPYLLLKGKQADAVLALWAENSAALALTGKISFGRCNPIPTWLRHFRDMLYFYVRDLNRRGIKSEGFAVQVRHHLEACQIEEAKLCR